MGVRIAQAMAYPMMKQYLSLGNEEFLVRIDVPQNIRPISVGKIRIKHPDTSLLLIIRDNKVMQNFNDDTIIQYPDRVVYTGLVNDLKFLSKAFREA